MIQKQYSCGSVEGHSRLCFQHIRAEHLLSWFTSSYGNIPYQLFAPFMLHPTATIPIKKNVNLIDLFFYWIVFRLSFDSSLLEHLEMLWYANRNNYNQGLIPWGSLHAKTNADLSKLFNHGVKQGCILLLLLSHVVTDSIMRKKGRLYHTGCVWLNSSISIMPKVKSSINDSSTSMQARTERLSRMAKKDELIRTQTKQI